MFDATRQSQGCGFCGATQLLPYEEVKEAFSPESLLPMKIAASGARELIKTWYGSRWFAPSKLNKAALTDTVKGLYIPYWTFDAQANADWEAEAGYHYSETEEYTDSSGNRQTRQIQRTRWEYASGRIDHFFDDDLVPASLGIQANHLRAVEPFPTAALAPYDPAYLSGWVVERYQIDLVAAAQRSRDQMEQQVQRMCASAVPGDTHRNLNVRTAYSGQTFKHIKRRLIQSEHLSCAALPALSFSRRREPITLCNLRFGPILPSPRGRGYPPQPALECFSRGRERQLGKFTISVTPAPAATAA